MGLHPTPALSYGFPPPSYDHVDGDALTEEECLDVMRGGGYLHVAGPEAAECLLRLLGMDETHLRQRMDLAQGLH